MSEYCQDGGISATVENDPLQFPEVVILRNNSYRTVKDVFNFADFS